MVDRLAETLVPAAKRQAEDPLAFIANRELFGDLVDNERFVSTYRSVLSALHAKGARATLEEIATAS